MNMLVTDLTVAEETLPVTLRAALESAADLARQRRRRPQSAPTGRISRSSGHGALIKV
jgi:hypothetical protein